MELFNQILEEKQAKYLFLLDSDGNYIVRYGITLKEKSLIETLDMVRFDKDNPQVHNSIQVLEKMKKKEEKGRDSVCNQPWPERGDWSAHADS